MNKKISNKYIKVINQIEKVRKKNIKKKNAYQFTNIQKKILPTMMLKNF